MHGEHTCRGRTVINLCVTADDYGLSRDINGGIHSLVAHRAVSAVSVMVHREARLDDVAALRGRVATGLHLMLVGERPLLPDRLAPLLDAQGFLPMRYWGLPLHFVNSHQHVHLLPPIWRRVMRAAHQQGFPPLLRTAEGTVRGGIHQTLLSGASRLAARLHPAARRLSLQAIGLGFAGRSTLQDIDDALARVARTHSEGAPVIYELVVHPGFEHAPAAARHLAWGIRWQREHDLLLSPDFHAVLRRHAAVLIAPEQIAAALGAS